MRQQFFLSYGTSFIFLLILFSLFILLQSLLPCHHQN